MRISRVGSTTAKSLLSYLFLLVSSMFFLFPITFTFMTSLQPNQSIYTLPPQFIFTPSLDSYFTLLELYQFTAYMINSISITLMSVAGSLLLGVPSAYALSRYSIKRSGTIAGTILSFRFLPPVAIAIPLFVLYRSIGLFDTQIGLVLIYIVMDLPFVVWLLRGFFAELPKDIEEAAEIDGVSRLRAFFAITIPSCYPGILATTLFITLLTWNEFGLALLLTGHTARTLPVQTLMFATTTMVKWGALCAGAIIIALPTLVFGIAIRKYLIRGLSLGTVR